MKSIVTNSRHQAFRDRVLRELQAEFADLPAEEMLAVTAQLVGQLVALQDQRRFSPQAVMQLVSANLEHGNRMMVDELLQKTAGSA